MRALLLLILSLVLPASLLRAEVYLRKDQALNLILGTDCEQVADPKPIDARLREDLDDQRLWGEDAETAFFFLCKKAGRVSGYALIDNEIGKHLPITYIVGISPEGTVTGVEIMVFREIRGWEVRERKFTEQFRSKALSDEMQVGRQISNMSGATLSSISITKGVKRALYLWQHFYGATVS